MWVSSCLAFKWIEPNGQITPSFGVDIISNWLLTSQGLLHLLNFSSDLLNRQGFYPA